MKKIISLVSITIVLALFVPAVLAAKPTNNCVTIQNGTLTYNPGDYMAGQIIPLGYDMFGYNYQAHIFNGSYANAYLGRPGFDFAPYTGDDTSYLASNPGADGTWMWPFRNIQLQMK